VHIVVQVRLDRKLLGREVGEWLFEDWRKGEEKEGMSGGESRRRGVGELTGGGKREEVKGWEGEGDEGFGNGELKETKW
jgi:hypothetical protein